jgi:predicted metal-dependent phosphoesterase TrpH
MTARLGRADLHLHSVASDGTATVDQILRFAEERTELDVIAITDHERIDAALHARDLAAKRGSRVQVVVGEEVTTRSGHLLGLFLSERVRPFRSLRSTIIEIHEQGGLAVPAHPLPLYPLCIRRGAIEAITADPDPRVHFDGLETFNASTAGRTHHQPAVELATRLGLAAIGGSDAHHVSIIGKCWTTFPGHTVDDVKKAILLGQTHAHGDFYGLPLEAWVYTHQVRKYVRDIRDDLRRVVLRRGRGRDLGIGEGRSS